MIQLHRRFIFTLLLILTTLLQIVSLRAEGDLKKPTQPLPQFKWKVGEELQYKVKYSFLTVGSLKFWILNKDTLAGRNVYRCRMHMKSSSAIPFVNLDDTYESLIDEDVFSHRAEAWEQGGDHILYTRYDFDYEQGKVLMFMEKRYKDDDRTEVVLDSSTVLNGRVQDGFSLLFFARANVERSDTADVTVFSFNNFNKTNINFTGKVEDVKAKGEKVDGYFLDGKMKFVGIAGLKEDFEGWFAQDAQRVPLHARMKAFLGSVRLNLHKWNNWDGEIKSLEDDDD